MSDNLEAVRRENDFMRRELDKLDNQVAQSMYASADTRDSEAARSAYQTTQGNAPPETMLTNPCYTEGPEPTSDNRRRVRIEESSGLDSYQPSRPVRTEASAERPSSLSKNPRYGRAADPSPHEYTPAYQSDDPLEEYKERMSDNPYQTPS